MGSLAYIVILIHKLLTTTMVSADLTHIITDEAVDQWQAWLCACVKTKYVHLL